MSDLVERVTGYLVGGGLFNPELAAHAAVRDLIIDCRAEIERLTAALAAAETTAWNAAIEAANDCCENCVITADNDYEEAYDEGITACIDAIRALRKDTK